MSLAAASFDAARAVADAVLFEGYARCPCPTSSLRDAARSQLGVLAPRAFSESDGGDPWWMQTQLLVVPSDEAHLFGTLRFLRLRRRRVHVPDGSTGATREVDSIAIDGRRLVRWDEADVHEIDFAEPLIPGEARTIAFHLAGDLDEEHVVDSRGSLAARVERRTVALSGAVRVRVEPVAAERPCVRVEVKVDNRSDWAIGGGRDEAIARSMLGAHLLLSIAGGGEILSAIDPPAWASEAAAACNNVRAFPVLAGDRSRRDVALAAPARLYDYPDIERLTSS